MLYVSYSALLLSLPIMFYSYGRYDSLMKGYLAGYGNFDYDELNFYRTLSFVGIGLVSACGAWMVTELVLYLLSVEKTLPSKAKKIKSKTLRKMEVERELEEQRALEAEEDLQSQENLEALQEDSDETTENLDAENSDGNL